MLLETEDVLVLGEALRFFRSLLHAEESGAAADATADPAQSTPGWREKLAAHPAAMARLLFIVENSLRAPLVLSATLLLEQLIYDDPDQIFASFGHAVTRFVPALCALLEPPAAAATAAAAWDSDGDGDGSSDFSAGGSGGGVDQFRETTELDTAAVKVLGHVSTTQVGVGLLVDARGRVAAALARVPGGDPLVTQIASSVHDVLR